MGELGAGSRVNGVRGAGEPAVAIAFVGVFAPEGDGPENPAYSAAGELLQARILRGLEDAGAEISAVFSMRTVASYPRTLRLLFGRSEQTVGSRWRARSSCTRSGVRAVRRCA